MKRATRTMKLTALAMSLCLCASAADPPKAKKSATEAVKYPPLAIGAQAPDFRLPGVDGKTYTLDDFKDAKVLVVIFTCNHCPTAQAYEKRFADLHANYRDKGVAVVA